MKTVIVLQARMTSTRLPGKVMMPILGKPLIAYEIERLKRCSSVSDIVLATTVNASDDPLASAAEAAGVRCFRGSEHDVLSRFIGAARLAQAEAVVRICGDCPIIDPRIVDATVRDFTEHASEADYGSNVMVRRLPRGMDAEVFWARLLDEADRSADAYEREHVTPFIYNRPDRFRLRPFVWPEDLNAHRWTVDTREDLMLMEKIIGALYPVNPEFGMQDVVELLNKNPSWNLINCHIQQKASA